MNKDSSEWRQHEKRNNKIMVQNSYSSKFTALKNMNSKIKNLILSKFSLLLIFFALAPIIHADNFQASIQAVEAGKSQTAMPHWWGFNPQDSTMALQAAINSGASKIIIKKMASPWIVRPIKLKSDQEIIFEEGVEIHAKKGAFKSIYDCLFTAANCKNITLTGKNTKLIMHKKDYHNASQYKKSEWRHGISLLSCENISIKGLTIKDSGGDGIYIGILNKAKNYCKNIKIENVVCDGNNRQGISVISVENLLVKDSKLINTNGTDPMAGIDFEPNKPEQRLVNCVVENCEIYGNANSGITTYIKLDKKSAPPVSITVKKCLIKNNKNGIAFSAPTGLHSVKGPVEGLIEIKDCLVEGFRGSSVLFENFRADSFKVIFEDCVFKNESASTPIEIVAASGTANPMGNLNFTNCKVVDKNKNQLIEFTTNHAPDMKLVNLTGSIIFNNTKIDLPEYIKQKGWDKSSEYTIGKIHLKQLKYSKRQTNSPATEVKDKLVFRSEVSFLFAANKNRKISFDFDYNMINRRKHNMKVSLESPAGVKTFLNDAIPDQDNHYSLIPEETGIFKVTCNPAGNTVSMEKSNVPYSISLPESGFLNLFVPQQPVYFDIPAGVTKLRIMVSGQSQRETVDIKIKLQRKIIGQARQISNPHFFDLTIKPASYPRTGVIEFNNAVEDVMIKIMAPILPIISVNEQGIVTQ